MRLKKLAILVTLLVLSTQAYAQAQDQEQEKEEENLKFDIGLEGMLGFSVGNDFYAFNVGGPSLILKLNNNWKLGLGALPSFYIKEGRAGAKLGVSPKIEYKNFVLIAPAYHFENPDKWIWSIGFGYKFHKNQ